jgi:hypothetical protein
LEITVEEVARMHVLYMMELVAAEYQPIDDYLKSNNSPIAWPGARLF